jgi:hypothetical protein
MEGWKKEGMEGRRKKVKMWGIKKNDNQKFQTVVMIRRVVICNFRRSNQSV